MLKTKCILAVPSVKDGLRISVMSRHTLSDGSTPHPEINEQSYDEWWPELAPPLQLLGDYYKRNLPWETFEESYLEHIEQAQQWDALMALGFLGLRQNVTIMCIEPEPSRCHRRLIAEACATIIPDLTIRTE